MAQWTFSAPEGYFDDCAALAAQLPNNRLTTRPLFALTPRDYPSDTAATKDNRPWARFTAHVAALNREAPANISYKIMFLTRHGQGYHNLMKTLSEDEQGEEVRGRGAKLYPQRLTCEVSLTRCIKTESRRPAPG